MKKILILMTSLLMMISLTSCDIIDKGLDFILPTDDAFGRHPSNEDNFFGNIVRFSDTNTPVVRDEDGYIKGCFVTDGVAGVEFNRIVDGDTAHFDCKVSEQTFNVRFLLIDAPEMSTSLGNASRDFVNERLTYAEAIIIDGLDAAHSAQGRTDVFGRWLGLVWYVPQGGNPQNLDEFRLLQLDIVEYSLAWHPGWGSMSNYNRRFVFNANRSEHRHLYNYFSDQFGSLCIANVVDIAYRRTRTLELLVNSDEFSSER